MHSNRFRPALLLALIFAAPALAAEPPAFELSFSSKIRSEPFTGRVIIYMSDKLSGQPRLNESWTSRQPTFSTDVKDWKPGETLRITDPRGYPFSLAELPAKKYAVQAVMHVNRDAAHSGKAPGNLYSKSTTVDLEAEDFSGVITLNIKKRVADEPTDASLPRSKTVQVRSKMLSRFRGRDVFHRAVVMLPEEYEKEPDRRFPAIYVIHGFGGDHFQSAMMAAIYGKTPTPCIKIGLDASCPLGHHVFADSDNNGPCGTALVEELIPYLEKEFRLIPEPRARLLTGHSSGGWSSLWLQVAYPDTFGGTWSTSPDPVTFKDFCRLDLYDPRTNFFRDSQGQQWPSMRDHDKVKLLIQDETTREDVVGPGGQFESFEAVFSPRGPDGSPRRLYDRKTGEIDPATANAWRKYDIVEKLKREWPTLGPKLAGKITIIMGGEDSFYLEGATKILKDELEKLGSDARVIIVPGKDHGSIMGSKPFRNMMQEMGERFMDKPSSAPSTPSSSKAEP